MDITNPARPTALGQIALAGEPTSVTVVGDNAYVGVNTSASFTNPSGVLLVVDVPTRAVIDQFPLPGQPDSVAASKDSRFVVVAIENERDEDVNDGAMPQLPGGSVAIFEVATGNLRIVDLTTNRVAAALYPSDPEPEYVDVNDDNIAVVALQENIAYPNNFDCSKRS